MRYTYLIWPTPPYVCVCVCVCVCVSVCLAYAAAGCQRLATLIYSL